MKELTKTELKSITGGSVWSPVVTVPVIVPLKVSKWVAGLFK
ncbi:bacteriocin [Streptococcus thoraltensis]